GGGQEAPVSTARCWAWPISTRSTWWSTRSCRSWGDPVCGSAVRPARCVSWRRPVPECFDVLMSPDADEPRIVRVTRDVAASAETLFSLIADPAQQPRWDGNDNLARADEGQRVTAVGDVFRMHLTNGGVRDNHVVEFEENRRIAW